MAREWWCEASHDYYDTEEQANEAALEYFDPIWDVYANTDVSPEEIIKALMESNHPYYEELRSKAEKQYLKENVIFNVR